MDEIDGISEINEIHEMNQKKNDAASYAANSICFLFS